MKKRVLTKWLKALRSGKYKQGRGALCQVDKKGNESFCCLGVLCDLYNKEQKRNKKRTLSVETVGPTDWLVGEISPEPHLVKLYESCDGTLPEEVIKWAGFRKQNSCGDFWGMEANYEDAPEELINLNDGSSLLKLKSHNFNQIADIIEEYHTHL